MKCLFIENLEVVRAAIAATGFEINNPAIKIIDEHIAGHTNCDLENTSAMPEMESRG